MTQIVIDRMLAPAQEGPTAVYDLAFVGAGASTSYVLIAFLDALAEQPPAGSVRIVVIERAPDPFSGIAYGSRAARTALLITPLRDFLPEGERRLFTEWLGQHKSWVFDEFRAADGPVSARWWDRHQHDVARDDYEDLFLPRYVFGAYLTHRARAAIARAADPGLATTEVIRNDVVTIDTGPSGYVLRCREGSLQARHTVLATGSSPVMPRLGVSGFEPDAVLVDDPFESMDAALDRVRASLQRRKAEAPAPHIVLLGGNAGTMDMLYQVNDLAGVATSRARFTVLSPRGELPERMAGPRADGIFRADLLAELSAQATVRAAQVYEAALADLTRGRDAGFSIADTLAPISDGVRDLLPRLSAAETLEFAGHWGVELGRHQRRAGWEYYEVVDELAADGRFDVVAGSFVGLVPAEGPGVRVALERHGVRAELDDVADVVINCGGPAPQLSDTAPSLVAGVIDKEIVRATRYGGGIAVDPVFEAAPRLTVMGPLLAGNVVNGLPIWHMEHCGRIIAFGAALGSRLARSVVSEPRTAST